jgi:hypothetical protein
MTPEVDGPHFIDLSMHWKSTHFQIGFADFANHS